MRWRKQRARTVRLYYASDVHGSELLWRKFLNAAKHYEVQMLIMGGDLTGKGLVPIVCENGDHTARVIGEERVARNETELAELLDAIRRNGMYPLTVTSDEMAQLRADKEALEAAFERAMVDEVTRWMALADARLADSEVMAFVMPGNDDPWSIDEALASGHVTRACDGRVVRAGEHELLSLGWSNRTPWNSPRELDEDELYRRLRGLADQLEAPNSAILNIHVPPHASGLDTAIEIDADFRPVLIGGQPHPIPVGSTAVRQILEEVQPALSLHGHVHESKGVARIGRTVAINPGSDYSSGHLEGCIVELNADTVALQHLVSG